MWTKQHFPQWIPLFEDVTKVVKFQAQRPNGFVFNEFNFNRP